MVSNKGKCSLRLNIFDGPDKMSIKMLTRNVFVDAPMFLKTLEHEHVLTFKLD